ncbi:hypothetical protein [Streptomyces sp. ODS28]|uniref:hypothetical protein n=1 Tax=Streptomyces sp. ODS28 TaxID=3136688 RepID=UPI0031E6A4CB
MSAFLQQLPALVGVVIGALGSYLAVMHGDRARFRREQRARWEERRLTAYGDYARSLKATVSLLYRVSAHLGNDPHPQPRTPEDAAPSLAEASERRDLAWEQVLLLGSPEVADAARLWARAVERLERFVRTGTRDSPEEWAALLTAQRECRVGFYEAARRDIGLPAEVAGRTARSTPFAGPDEAPRRAPDSTPGSAPG